MEPTIIETFQNEAGLQASVLLVPPGVFIAPAYAVRVLDTKTGNFLPKAPVFFGLAQATDYAKTCIS